jgi:uncharacterized protein YjeT (DUF2065 family)
VSDLERPGSSRAAVALVRPLLALAGLYHLALGLAAFMTPRAFYDAIATYPPYNDHFLRDVGSLYLALGAVMLVAVARRSWQAPVLAFTTIQYAIHTVAHVIDVTGADPDWLGAASAGGLAALTVLFGWLLRAVGRSPR